MKNNNLYYLKQIKDISVYTMIRCIPIIIYLVYYTL